MLSMGHDAEDGSLGIPRGIMRNRKKPALHHVKALFPVMAIFCHSVFRCTDKIHTHCSQHQILSSLTALGKA